MPLGIRCFAGCNTPRGFISGFEGIYEGRARAFFIKGAPGVGKSSLMRRVAARQSSTGHAVSQFFCSSDPDSLDGIADEALNVSMLDATSPHACDPPLPGARDTLISLGDFLDEAALEPFVEEIDALKARAALEFERAYHYLAAAARARSANLAFGSGPKGRRFESGTNRAYADARTRAVDEVFSALPRIGKRAGLRRGFFLSAHTCRGYINFENDFPPGIALSMPAPPCEALDALLRAVGEEALRRGLDATYFLDPMCPERALHLYLPGIPLFLTSRSVPGALRTYEDLFEDPPEDDEKTAKLSNELAALAREALLRAKALHDETEAIYTPRMDFSGLADMETRVARAIMALEAQTRADDA